MREAAAPALRDLAASGMSLPDIRDETHEDRESEAVCARIQGPGRTGEGICVSLDCSPAEQVVQLAEQFQNWAADQLHDAGLPPEWPECPGASIPPPAFSGPQGRSGDLGVPGKWARDLGDRCTGEARRTGQADQERGPPGLA